MIVCLDTAPLIWAMKPRTATLSEREKVMVPRMRAYLAICQRKGHEIVVPAQAFAEYLQGLPGKDQRAKAASVVTERIRVLSFDASTALRAADLAAGAERVPDGTPGHRQEFKVDVEIAAVALEAGADVIITGDPDDFNAIVRASIRVEEVPDVGLQEQMPML